MTLVVDRKPNVMNFSEEKIKLLKDTVCKGASDSELEMFLHICKHTGLDPFMKQIYSIPRGGMRTTQTSIDGFRLIAERTGRYAPGKESTFAYNEKGEIISATSWVRKMTPDGTWHDVGATAYMAEFMGATPFWKKMPHVMLAKVAEAVALRKAFPADLSGIYTAEEMDQAEVQIQPIEDKIDVDAKEKQILDQFTGDMQESYAEYLKAGHEYYEYKDKRKWPKNWSSVLDKWIETPESLITDYNKSQENKLGKKAVA